MKTCEKFRDLILTDYVDEELEVTAKQEVEAHLLVCSECRQLADEVRRDLIQPFQQAPRQEIPDQVWSSIRNKITEAATEKSLLDRLIELLFPKAAVALGSLAVLILMSTFLFNNWQKQQAKEKDQGEYLAYLLESPSASAETESNGLSTSIETYFL